MPFSPNVLLGERVHYDLVQIKDRVVFLLGYVYVGLRRVVEMLVGGDGERCLVGLSHSLACGHLL